jgi:hypothetical protein
MIRAVVPNREVRLLAARALRPFRRSPAQPPQLELPVADEIRRESDVLKGSQRVTNGDPVKYGERPERLADQPKTEHPDPTGRDDTDARERQSRR